jgi:hypothetical protein
MTTSQFFSLTCSSIASVFPPYISVPGFKSSEWVILACCLHDRALYYETFTCSSEASGPFPDSPHPNKAAKGGKLVRSIRFYCDADAVLQGRTRIVRLSGLSREDLKSLSPACHCGVRGRTIQAHNSLVTSSNPNISTCPPQRLSGSVFFRLKRYMSSSFYTSIPSAGCADNSEAIAPLRTTDCRPFIHY